MRTPPTLSLNNRADLKHPSSETRSRNPKRPRQQFFSSPAKHLLAASLTLLLCASGLRAVNLTWDAGNTNNGPAIDPGSGSWNTDTTTNLNWYNGSANVSWSQSSTTVGTMG